MSDVPKDSEDSVELSGVPVAEFSVAVTVFEQLRNEGAFSLFLGRGNAVRVIGEVAEFAARLKKALPDSDASFVEASLEEIRQYVQLLLSFKSPEQAASAWLEGPYRMVAPQEDESTGARKNHLTAKITHAQRLINRGLEARSNRLATSLAPVLEDVDIDVVSARQSRLDNRTIKTPFLRLGIRYSKPAHDVFWYPAFSKFRSDLKQFDLECDVADLDLLIARLYRAKELLTEAITNKSEPQPPRDSESK